MSSLTFVVQDLPVARTPCKLMLECDVVDGMLRVFVDNMPLPVMAAEHSHAIILHAEGPNVLLSFGRKTP